MKIRGAKEKQSKRERTEQREPAKSVIAAMRWQNLAMALANLIIAFLFFLPLDPGRWVPIVLAILFFAMAAVRGIQFFVSKADGKYKRANGGLIFLFISLAILFLSIDMRAFSSLLGKTDLAALFAALIFFFEGGMQAQYTVFRYGRRRLDWWVNLIFAVACFTIGILLAQYGKGHHITTGVFFLILAVVCIYTIFILKETPKEPDREELRRHGIYKADAESQRTTRPSGSSAFYATSIEQASHAREEGAAKADQESSHEKEEVTESPENISSVDLKGEGSSDDEKKQ